MAHFAKIENNVVTQVIVAEQDFVDTQEGQWVQTSYNARIRKNFAGIGFTYDSQRDAFIPPKPYPSWALIENTCQWEAPIQMPTDGYYKWDESTTSWVEVTV
jgi:hypothetical protein